METNNDILDDLKAQADLVSRFSENLGDSEALTEDATGIYLRSIAEIRRLRELVEGKPKRKRGDHDTPYLDLLRHIKAHGTNKSDRTGTGTRSIFGYQMRFDLQEGFPLLTTKKVSFKNIAHELLWFLSGSTNIKYLQDNGVTIWDEWADENGELGPVYGSQWRSWPEYCDYAQGADQPWPENSLFGHVENGHKVGVLRKGIDQISNLVNDLRNNADSRRLIVSAWNVADIPHMKLPPCHAFFQFYTTELTLAERDALSEFPNQHRGTTLFGKALCGDEDSTAASHKIFDEQGIPRRRLSCQLYQRSADTLLGVPYNIASYALLTHMLAQQTNMVVGDFIWTGGDCHIYDNHVQQVELQISRTPLCSPKLEIVRKPGSIFDYTIDDFTIIGYEHHEAIKAPVAV